MSTTETELKLEVRPDDIERLLECPVLNGASATSKASRQLQSTYFDTADLRLRRHDMTLRIRRQGDRFVQTVKGASDAAGGLLVRGEWECPVAGEEPDLGAIDAQDVRERLRTLADGELRPVFSTEVTRDLRLFGGADGAVIEVAIDTGEILTADGRRRPISEIELELKQGRPHALYDLALALSEFAPLRVETRAKSDRGYDLAVGEEASAIKAGPLAIERSLTVEQAFESIVRHCLSHLIVNQSCALGGAHVEGIHQMRVALRRLRSAFGLFRPALPPGVGDAFIGEIKWLAGQLGSVRNWDVFLDELVSPLDPVLDVTPSLVALRQAVMPARAAALQEARDAILSPRYAVLVLKLGAWVEGRGWRSDMPYATADLEMPIHRFADRLLARGHKKALKRGAHFARMDWEERHRLRIALKKLRYSAEFFRSLYDRTRTRRYVKRLTRLQDVLGRVNDVATARSLLDGLAAAAPAAATHGWQRGAGIVIGWHGRDLVALEPVLVAEWERFEAAKPFWSKDRAIG